MAGADLDAHGCAIATDGRVWCWGSDTDGELGDTTCLDGTCGRVPVRVSGLP